MRFPFILRMIKTSIGKKQIQAITGLLLAAFVIYHFTANLLLLKGEEWYNGFVNILKSSPTAILIIEIILFLVFFIHIFIGLWLRYENWIRSRARKYAMINWQGGRTIGSSTMLYTAIIILIFLIVHLINFKYSDQAMGFYQMVTSAFRKGTFAIGYIIAFTALALHLSHGIQSAFQTLGIYHDKYNLFIKILSYLVAVVMIVGFTYIVAYFYLGLDIKPDTDLNLFEMGME